MRVLVVGGGFYGASIAASCAESGDDVVLAEARDDLLLAASALNQARVHGGYHYPRARITALRSREHYNDFITTYRDAVDRTVSSVYGIARESRTSPRQFERMMEGIGAPLRLAPRAVAALFNPDLVVASYSVDEAVYNVDVLREVVRERLATARVDVRTRCEVTEIEAADGGVEVCTSAGPISADFVVLATYGSAADTALGSHTSAKLHCEPCEMLLVEMPEALRGFAFTIMDGPFFSLVPSPSRGLHTLSHVRYTPLAAYRTHVDALRHLELRDETRAAWMLRDVKRFMPSLEGLRLAGSQRSVKVVAGDRDYDDARPIVVEGAPGSRVVSVLGSKMDNVADAVHVVHELKAAVAAPTRRPVVAS